MRVNIKSATNTQHSNIFSMRVRNGARKSFCCRCSFQLNINVNCKLNGIADKQPWRVATAFTVEGGFPMFW